VGEFNCYTRNVLNMKLKPTVMLYLNNCTVPKKLVQI